MMVMCAPKMGTKMTGERRFAKEYAPNAISATVLSSPRSTRWSSQAVSAARLADAAQPLDGGALCRRPPDTRSTENRSWGVNDPLILRATRSHPRPRGVVHAPPCHPPHSGTKWLAVRSTRRTCSGPAYTASRTTPTRLSAFRKRLQVRTITGAIVGLVSVSSRRDAARRPRGSAGLRP